MARFSRCVPPYNLNFGILPVTAVNIPRTAVTAASIVIPIGKVSKCKEESLLANSSNILSNWMGLME